MGRTGRPNLIHYAIGDSASPAPGRMLRGAPPAAGPARGPWAAGGLEELHDSEWSREMLA
jgi:hypothetical protein